MDSKRTTAMPADWDSFIVETFRTTKIAGCSGGSRGTNGSIPQARERS